MANRRSVPKSSAISTRTRQLDPAASGAQHLVAVVLDGAVERCRLLHLGEAAQDTQLQRDALGDAGATKFFQDKFSSRRAERPGLAAALDYLRGSDVLMVWKLDRLGRSVKEVLTIADELYERGVGLRVLTGTLAGTYAPPARASSSSPSWPRSPSWNAT